MQSKKGMEIGSIYEINPAWAEAGETENEQRLSLAGTAKYGKKFCRYTASGREAIALALRSLEQHRPALPKRCLLPAYMCDTVFFPFEHAGWELHFYHISRELRAGEEELRRKIEQVRPGLLFVHPYYGVDTWKPMRPLLLKWREQGICIMEDVTQSYYLEEAGKEADYVVCSLRKWYPVPDGGFAASDESFPDVELENPESYAEARLEILIKKWEYLNDERSVGEKQDKKSEFLKRNRELEEELDRYDGVRGLSGKSLRILQRTDEERAAGSRKDNYRYLYERLCGKTQFWPVLKPEEAGGNGAEGRTECGTAPLYFAVYAREREELQRFLQVHDIYAPVLWPAGAENENILSEEEKYIYRHMLVLPMDQRYGPEEMQYMAETMEEYERQRTEGAADGRNFTDGAEPVVGIRADANETVAMGHMMRCITIAEQLKRKGFRVVFFTADEYARGLLEQAGMDWVCLHSEWNRMETEIPQLREAVKREGCRKLLVDSYQADAEYFDGLRDLCKLVYMDDCFEGVYPVDLLVNYNAYHVRFPYEETYRGKTRLLLGTSYVPLREEFQRQEGGAADGKSGRPHILLSSGGGDMYHALAGVLAEAVKDAELQQVVFDTVVGNFSGDAEELERLAGRYPGIRLHRNVKHMAELMESCSAAVSAAGTMLFELSAMGIPSVFFVSADNQQYDREFFAVEERMLFAGDIRTQRQECLERICSGLKRILKDADLQQRMREALHKVTDGRGAERIAEAVLEL
jgi:pseudaminic acid biosynthesis-associated protein PseG